MKGQKIIFPKNDIEYFQNLWLGTFGQTYKAQTLHEIIEKLNSIKIKILSIRDTIS